MSGRKYTTIDSNTLNELRRDAAKLRGLRQDLPQRIETAVRETQRDIDRRLSPIEARQRQYEKALSGMSQEVREVEQRVAQRISQHAKETKAALQESAARMERQRRELRQEIQKSAEDIKNANQETEKRLVKQIKDTESRMRALNDEVRSEMHQQEQRLTSAIDQERKERERGLQAVNQRISSIESTRERMKNLAEARIEDAKITRDFVAENYQYEHFLPGRLDSLEIALASAQESSSQGAHEAALAQANTVFQDLSNLRIELEQLDSEWRIWREQALQTTDRILSEASANRVLSDIEEGGELAEVDYWTQGELTILLNELEQIRKAAGDETHPMSIAEMRELVEESLPEMDGRLDRILEKAYLEVERSQLRVSIADVAAGIFESQAFTIEDSTFEGEDMRAGFVIKARNRAGSEIVAAVTPDGDHEKITIDSFDVDQKSPEELRNRACTIANAMQEHNLQAGSPTEESKTPSNENRDLDKVRRRKPMLQQTKTRL